MSKQGLTAGLAAAVRTSQPEHSDAIREAKKGLLDFTAASFAGREDKGIQKLLRLIEDEGAGPLFLLSDRAKRPRHYNPRCSMDLSPMHWILMMSTPM